MPFLRNGYGQVEPNQLSAQITGQIFASLPLDPDVQVLQNGEFMYYDYANGSVNAGKTAAAATATTPAIYDTVGEPMLVFNEVKLYDEFWRTSYKDFAIFKTGDNYVTSKLATAKYGENSDLEQAATISHDSEYGYRLKGIAPRLFKTNVGDVYTTNMVEAGSQITYAQGDILAPEKHTWTYTNKAGNSANYYTLVLKKQDKSDLPDGMLWSVVKVYTMPDGQQGLKLQRVQ